MTPSPACYALVRNSEGCKLESYADSGGVWTIGCGHTDGVTKGMTCTPQQAEEWLEHDMAWAAAAVNRNAMPCTQGQFDALTDFTFNLGIGTLLGSTLLHKHKAKDYAGAAAEFSKWVHCGDKVLRGLVLRRAAEAQLYLEEAS